MRYITAFDQHHDEDDGHDVDYDVSYNGDDDGNPGHGWKNGHVNNCKK